MALDMSLEIEGEKPDWEALGQAALATGVEDFANPLAEKGVDNFLAKYYNKEERFDGYFLKSFAHFRLHKKSVLGKIYAEGNHGCDFNTQYSIIFRINNNYYDEFVEDIRKFLNTLVAISPMQFVLSFQYEGIYASRHKDNFEFFWDAPR